MGYEDRYILIFYDLWHLFKTEYDMHHWYQLIDIGKAAEKHHKRLIPSKYLV